MSISPTRDSSKLTDLNLPKSKFLGEIKSCIMIVLEGKIIHIVQHEF